MKKRKKYGPKRYGPSSNITAQAIIDNAKHLGRMNVYRQEGQLLYTILSKGRKIGEGEARSLSEAERRARAYLKARK